MIPFHLQTNGLLLLLLLLLTGFGRPFVLAGQDIDADKRNVSQTWQLQGFVSRKKKNQKKNKTKEGRLWDSARKKPPYREGRINPNWKRFANVETTGKTWP